MILARLALPLTFLFLAAACGSVETSEQVDAPVETPSAGSPIAFGFALSPRSYEGTDLPDFLDQVEGNANVLMHAGDWLDLEQPNSPFHVMSELAAQRDMAIVAIVSPNSAGQLLRPIDESVRNRYLVALRSFVADTQPAFLGLANEVNMLASTDPAGYADVVSLWGEAVEIVRAESPDTSVFVTFEFEWLLGRQDGWFGGSEVDANWDVLEQFPGADAVAFTTYPSLVFDNPSDLPSQYYRQIADHTDLPIYFSEIGWTADPDLALLPGSETEQIAYIDLLEKQLVSQQDVELLIWSFVHADLVTDEPFAGMGLWRADGTPRPSWRQWLELSSG